jgi:hypothetical protein
MPNILAELLSKATGTNPVTVALAQKLCDLQGQIENALADKLGLAQLQALREQADRVMTEIHDHLAMISADAESLEAHLETKFQEVKLHMISLNDEIQAAIDKSAEVGYFKNIFKKFLDAVKALFGVR